MVRLGSVAAMTERVRGTAAPTHVAAPADVVASAPVLAAAAPQRLQPVDERAPVIRSKIQPPPVRSSTLSRQRLLDRLTDAVSGRVTLVTAEAGYGKTTLLADFSARASARCLWYKLDRTDADPITWTNYLIAAAREVDPAFGAATLSLLAQVGAGGPPESAFVASLLGELPRLGEAPTVLVLDDFHLVDGSSEARDYVSRLIKDAPPWLHFVIASRQKPPLELGRIAAGGELAEITTDDLRFTTEETGRLFADGYGLALEPDVLHDLDARTQGWAASLQLFHGSVRGRPLTAVRALAKSLSGAVNPIYDFLAQEVLNNISDELEEFLVRISLLERVVPRRVVPLFVDRGSDAPSTAQAEAWIEEADHLGLLPRTSLASEGRRLHPLLREFLLKQSEARYARAQIRAMHLAVAQEIERDEPLVASRHFLEADCDDLAMACLGRSAWLAVGSGQWGLASELVDRVQSVTASPVVASIRARRSLSLGDLEAARATITDVIEMGLPAEDRAAIRHARLVVGWRTGDTALMYEALNAIESDPETPLIMYEIAHIYIDASPMATSRPTLGSMAQRLVSMAGRLDLAGHHFFAAIGLHNAAVAFLNAGEFDRAIRTGTNALSAFDGLSYAAPEQYSTHAILAAARLELGQHELVEEHFAAATVSGEEFADVAAELALGLFATGDKRAASLLLARANALVRAGMTDSVATMVTEQARAVAELPGRPAVALSILDKVTDDSPLDFGHVVAQRSLVALALMLAGRRDESSKVVKETLPVAQAQGANRSVARLVLTGALAAGDAGQLRRTLAETPASGELALLEAADAVAASLDLLDPVPAEIELSIGRWPARWLPALRRQLETGNTPPARVAASLLDRFGDTTDVPRLRAYVRAYRRRGRLIAPLGVNLARRVSPRLKVRDLGRVSVVVGERVLDLAAMRRKPASLLMYLVTRPSLTANREQILDELWPDGDPSSASNSLNQSLYFLRREFDPWYEDGVSVDYITFQGDLVWLDPQLSSIESVAFFSKAGECLRGNTSLDEVIEVVSSYRGLFAPEFEYEDWAMAWRSRLHATFLELATRSTDRAIRDGDLGSARDIATAALDVDGDQLDLERRLVWLYWHLGARSAAAAQYEHLANREREDGIEAISLPQLVALTAPS